MKPILLLAGALGAGAVGTAAVVLPSATSTQVYFTDWDDERPGPDSARLAQFLGVLEAADPVTCELLSEQVGNGWWSGSDWGIGRVADRRTDARAARDSLSGRVRDAGAIQRLTATLGHENPCVRESAARMLGRSAADDAVIAVLLDDESPRVREAALVAAGRSDRPGLRRKGEAMLRDRQEPVAAMAAAMLGELEDPASVGPLAEALERGGLRLRKSAAWALGEIEDVKALPSLRRALRDQDPVVRAIAANSLGNIESADAAEDLERLVGSDPDRRVRLEAIEALGDIEAPRSANALGAVLDGSDIELAIAAAEAISNLDDLQQAPAALTRAAASPDPRLRLAVANALGNIADPATTEALTRLLADANPEVRRAAVEGLGGIGSRESVPALTRALSDTDAEVRRAVAEALGEIEED